MKFYSLLIALALTTASAMADEPVKKDGNTFDVTLDDQIHNDAEGMSIGEIVAAFSKKSATPETNASNESKASKFMAAFDPSLKFGGYIIGKYSATDQKTTSHSSFDLRLVRLYMNGYCRALSMRSSNGNTSTSSV